MKTEIRDINSPTALAHAADALAGGALIVVYFHGTYAFLCDCHAVEPAERIFALKNRPKEKNLSLVVDPQFLPDFVDLTHPAFARFPLAQTIQLQRSLHALGVILPAAQTAPADLLQNGTILNVWTEYLPHRPLAQLTQLAHERGVRGFKGASTNLSDEPTYNTVAQVVAQFDGKLPLILDDRIPLPRWRRKSTTLVDLTGAQPQVVRAGNVPTQELQMALDEVGFGRLSLAPNLKTL